MGKSRSKPQKSSKSSPAVTPQNSSPRKQKTTREGESLTSPRRAKISETDTPTRKKSSRINANCELPVKKNRLEVEPVALDEEKTRRRRTLKHGEAAPPLCCFCKEEQKETDERLKKCETCKAYYHIVKCLKYKQLAAKWIWDNEAWNCARCSLCAACLQFIDDPGNTECLECTRAWHGACKPKGLYLSDDFDSDWICNFCNRGNYRHKRDNYVTVPTSSFATETPTVIPRLRRRRQHHQGDNDTMQFEGDVEELTKLMEHRDYVWDTLAYKAGLATEKPTPLEVEEEIPLVRKKGKKKRTESSSSYSGDGSDVEFVTPYDEKIYSETKEKAYSPQPTSSSTSSTNTTTNTTAPPDTQWLHFGTGKACKAIYPSAYAEPLYSAPRLYACKFCLHTTHNKLDFMVHWKHCAARFPPGNEIYRYDGLAFFEVDGANQKTYCQALCKIAKLFIASKTLYDEVETFIFYVLCEIQPEGYVIVGYFSKEKNPSKNNNLSCLLVLPMAQKMGYGRLLIDMSYELSRIEHRIGHPEHPLSDLGILAYRGYWRSSLLCYLRSNRHLERVNLKDICLATRIAPVDIVNQLMLDNLIVLKHGIYSIKIGKRALKFPLSKCRRRAVEASHIQWKPTPSGEVLDPNKINTYV